MVAALLVALQACSTEELANPAPSAESTNSSAQPPASATPVANKPPHLLTVEASSDVNAERYLYPTTTGSRDDTQNWADLYLPPGEHDPESVPLIVLIHGGSWEASIGADTFANFSRQLSERGLAVYNLEYRRLDSGGGWPTTFSDVAAALDYVPQVAAANREINTDNAVVVGHSAGGQLAMWGGTRHRLGGDEVGANPKFRPTDVVSLAGPLDMRQAVRLGDTRIVRALGGTPAQVPDRYASVDPIENIDPAIPITAMAGTADTVVSPTLAQRYVDAVHRDGGTGQVILLNGVNHVQIVDPSAPTFPQVLDTISRASQAAHHR